MSEHTEHIIQFFEYSHLPERLQNVSSPFCRLAHALVESLPRNPERTVALRKLLEAKDAAVRALLAVEPSRFVKAVGPVELGAPFPASDATPANYQTGEPKR